MKKRDYAFRSVRKKVAPPMKVFATKKDYKRENFHWDEFWKPACKECIENDYIEGCKNCPH